MKTIIIIPTYNERENIATIIEQIFQVIPSISILVIDDNSPDGTDRIVKDLQNDYKNIYLLVRDKKMGLGSAYVEGFRYAKESGYDILLQMDADLAHSPLYIPLMIKLLKDYDLVIGSRYVCGGGVLNWGLGRVFLSRTANIFTKFVLNVPFNDLSSGFKCIKRSLLESIDFTAITSKGYAFQIEMVYKSYLAGFRIGEYPIIFKGRYKDVSKMSLSIVIEAICKVLYLFARRIRKKMK